MDHFETHHVEKDELDTVMTSEHVKPAAAMATGPAPMNAWGEDTEMDGSAFACAAAAPTHTAAAAPSAAMGAPAACAIAPPCAIVNLVEEELPTFTRQFLDSKYETYNPSTEPFGVAPCLDAVVCCSSSDILASMRKSEQKAATSKHPRHLSYRRHLVDLMCEVGERFRFHKTTIHTAVEHLDRILQEVSVTKERLELIALCCLQLAAKFAEAEESVPSAGHFGRFASHRVRTEMIHHMELMVVTRLQWTMKVTTPLHFVNLFVTKGIVFNTDRMQGMPLIEKVPRYVQKYVEFFADLTLQEYEFKEYCPSLLAAAIVAASRRALSIRPLWNDQLTELVGYNQEQIADAFTRVWRYYLECFPDEGAAADASHAVETTDDVIGGSLH